VADQEIDLILESTGRTDVFDELNRSKTSSVSLVGSAGARVIYSLLDSYNEVNRHLQSYKINLERRIMERTEELENLNAELAKEKVATEILYERERELNQEKSKYLIHTTHQLKAPFAAIQNYVDIILDGYTGEITDETREVILKIKARCELLSENIRDMLELAKLKAQVIELIREEKPLQELVGKVVERFQVVAAAKHIHIATQVPPQQLLCRTIHKQLFELLATLVENAIKYSPPETTVTIKLAVGASGKPTIDVADQGIGIPKDHLTKIFTEYFRSNNAVRHDPNGNGLGLAIANEIAKLLEMTLEVESELGKGSTFHLRC
jgi:signal transduction histidine kinase